MENIIEFAQNLGINLGIGQRVFLKLAYELEFDDSISYPVEDPVKMSEPRQMTEFELFKELGEISIDFGDKDSRFVSAVLGRRSGKTLLGALVMSYELELFLKKNPDPCINYNLVKGSKFFFYFFAPTSDSSQNAMEYFLNLVEARPFLKSRIGHNNIGSISFKTAEDIDKGRSGSIEVCATSFSSNSYKGKNIFMVVMDEIEFGYDFKNLLLSISPSLNNFPDNLNFTFSTKRNNLIPMTRFCKPKIIFRGYTTLMRPNSLSEKDVRQMVRNNFTNFVNEFCV